MQAVPSTCLYLYVVEMCVMSKAENMFPRPAGITARGNWCVFHPHIPTLGRFESTRAEVSQRDGHI